MQRVEFSWENGLHFHHAVDVSQPHSTQESGVVGAEVRDTNFEISDVELWPRSQALRQDMTED
jgi:hypothetical protein